MEARKPRCFSVHHLLLLLLPISIIILPIISAISTSQVPAGGGGGGFYVCEPERYREKGLDMREFGFCNKSLSYHVRVKDLVDRMNVTEKVQNLGSRARGAPRIGLPPYQWWSEALHGISDQGTGGVRFDEQVPAATSFPQVILTAATFNETLWKAIGEVVSTEGRAMYNLNHAGLTYWSPVVNLVRDPRWGRTLETAGEDPFVAGRYAVNFVRGLQDIVEHGASNATSSSTTTPTPADDLDSRPLKVSACCKHMAAYDLEVWNNATRFTFDAKVTKQDMLETFLRPFEMCVREGDVSSIMCSYNQVDGIPACADPVLLNQTLRNDWNLHGYIVADCDAVEEMKVHQNFLNYTPEETVGQALRAGLNLDCENWRTLHSYYQDHMEDAVKQGKAQESDIDRSLAYLYLVLMRLGYFDGDTPFDTLGKEDICTPHSIELAAETAREGIVLLKNDDGSLPLNPNKKVGWRLALIGPHINATDAMLGNYAGKPCRMTSMLQGFSEYTDSAAVMFEKGCRDVACKDQSLFDPALEAAKAADATLLAVGLDKNFETEDTDRTSLLLPGYQGHLIEQVARVSKGPVVLIIMAAGGVDITTSAKLNNAVKAILWVGYPGEQGGRATADVVFGKYNPGGRLPVTWYPNDYLDKVPMTSMLMRPNPQLGYPGRTYKFYDGPVVYPFGYGLSYSQFVYDIIPPTTTELAVKLGQQSHCSDLDYQDNADKPSCPAARIEDLSCTEQDVGFNVVVRNVGSMDGSEIIIVYSKPPDGISGAPLKQVIGFRRAFVPAGGSKAVGFTLNSCTSLSIIDYKASRLLPSGKHTIIVGDRGSRFHIEVNLVL